MLTAIQQARLSSRPCGCGAAVLDPIGNVVRVESCPVCLKIALDFLREGCYNANDVEGTRPERQLDMFDEGLQAEGPLLSLLLGEEQHGSSAG